MILSFSKKEISTVRCTAYYLHTVTHSADIESRGQVSLSLQGFQKAGSITSLRKKQVFSLYPQQNITFTKLANERQCGSKHGGWLYSIWMIDKGKGAVKTPGCHWSMTLIGVIRIHLNDILWWLLKTSAPLLRATGHSTILSEGKGQAKETLAEHCCDRKINCPIRVH